MLTLFEGLAELFGIFSWAFGFAGDAIGNFRSYATLFGTWGATVFAPVFIIMLTFVWTTSRPYIISRYLELAPENRKWHHLLTFKLDEKF
ncbi:hypothetical protein KAR91_00660 [Candidatus Pacearchaeota archaeon]|nr:hypothetical protein [Candidatus Pacearchaeota archaeon]